MGQEASERSKNSRNGNFVQMELMVASIPTGWNSKSAVLSNSEGCPFIPENFHFNLRMPYPFEIVEPKILAQFKCPRSLAWSRDSESGGKCTHYRGRVWILGSEKRQGGGVITPGSLLALTRPLL